MIETQAHLRVLSLKPQPKKAVYKPAAILPVVSPVSTPKLIVPKVLTPRAGVRYEKKVVAPTVAGGNSSLPSLVNSVPVIKKPREEVLMGSFGSTDGLPATKVTQQPNVNAAGFPDVNMHGDGGLSTGTSKKGISAVTGFGDGNGMGSGTGNGNSNRREVAASGFSDFAAAAAMIKPIAAQPRVTALQIPSKTTSGLYRGSTVTPHRRRLRYRSRIPPRRKY